jgi:hypothetical protein
MKTSGDLQKTISGLVALFLPLCTDKATLIELQELVKIPEHWHLGHKLFDRIRDKNLAAIKAGDTISECQYCFEEVCAQSLYNLSSTDAPFDPDAPEWIVPNAVDFAKSLGIGDDVVLSTLGRYHSVYRPDTLP